MNWEYLQPVKIKFGENSLASLPELIQEIGGENGLLLSDPYFVENGLAQQVIEQSKGAIKEVFAAVSPNPDVSEVDACASMIRKNKLDFVVALGGGSAIDAAKAAATICLTEESIAKYHGTGEPIHLAHLPFIAIPTTSGTGTEVTCVSVLTDKKLGKKAPIASPGFYPDFALIDPALTLSMPPHITASTGIDVLSHAIEGYWSVNHQPICDALALHAIKLVFKYLPTAYETPSDMEAREKMAEASVIAGMAFTLPKTTSSHACSYPLTNIYQIPHGEACGLTLDFFARINGSEPRVQHMASELGFDSVDALADAIAELKQKVGLRVDMKEFELSDEQVAELVQLSRHPNLDNNPVKISDEMLFELYEGMR